MRQVSLQSPHALPGSHQASHVDDRLENKPKHLLWESHNGVLFCIEHSPHLEHSGILSLGAFQKGFMVQDKTLREFCNSRYLESLVTSASPFAGVMKAFLFTLMHDQYIFLPASLPVFSYRHSPAHLVLQ
jgi:hypothetical protein